MSYLSQMKTFTFTLWIMGILTLMGFAVIPNLMVIENGADKMLHMTAFCLLTLWPTVTFIRMKHVYISAAILFSSGIVVEVLQGFVPMRTPSMEDILANLAGVAAGLVIGMLIRSDTLQH